jgi:hypothetical protein
MANTIDELRVTQLLKANRLETGYGFERQYLVREDLAEYTLDLGNAKIWDSGQPLTATPASDDLGLIAGTFGTANLYLSAGDLKAAGATTRRCRILAQLPPEYDAGQDVVIRIAAGMLTTASDGTCTVDAEAYLVGRTTLKSGSDLVSTSATSINSLTFAEKSFTVTAGSLSAGDVLDIRISIACNDAATGTAVTPAIAAIDLLCDIKG